MEGLNDEPEYNDWSNIPRKDDEIIYQQIKEEQKKRSEKPRRLRDEEWENEQAKKKYEEEAKKLREQQAKQDQEIFTIKETADKDRLCRKVIVSYQDKWDIKVRLFFGKRDDPVLYSRDYTELEENNEIQFEIKPSNKGQSTRWVKKGLHDVGDNFERGYSLTVTLQYDDPILRKSIIDILSKHRFGSLPASHYIHAHLDDEAPSSVGAEKILNKIIKTFQHDKPWKTAAKKLYLVKAIADLSYKNWQGKNLSGEDLSGEDLSGTNLSGEDLSGTNLSSAKLVNANLSSAKLVNANLSNANLRYANLADAYLPGADLRGADLRNVDLLGANFTGADLRGADIRGTPLGGVYYGAGDLEGAIVDPEMKEAYERGKKSVDLWWRIEGINQALESEKAKVSSRTGRQIDGQPQTARYQSLLSLKTRLVAELEKVTSGRFN